VWVREKRSDGKLPAHVTAYLTLALTLFPDDDYGEVATKVTGSYRCHPENNNRGRPDKYAGHPATIYMREDLIMIEVNRFFAERIFGPQRRELFLADLDQVDDTAQRERQAQRQRLQHKLADTACKQDNVLRQAEDADPTDPFTQGLRQRYNDLATERQTLLATIAELDSQDADEPDRPSTDQLGLLDALPHLAVNLDRAPAELLDRLFELTQLTVQVHYATDEATSKVTLPADDVINVAEIGQAVEETMPAQAVECGKSAGQGLCTCPR
jgi:hypothetical protein